MFYLMMHLTQLSMVVSLELKVVVKKKNRSLDPLTKNILKNGLTSRMALINDALSSVKSEM